MAKKSMIEREKKRQRLVAKYAAKRAELKSLANDETKPFEERFKARLKLAELPRNSSATRLHNRCQLTGRPHAYYRKLKISRIMLRDLGSKNGTTVNSLRHFRDEVNEATLGTECGIVLQGYNDFEQGDVLEAHREERGRR